MSGDWQVAKLSDVCEFRNGLWKGEKGPLLNVGVIRNTNFTKEGTLDESDIAYIDVEEKKFAKRQLQFGDIILEKSGGGPKQAVGRVALFEKRAGNFSFSNFTSAIRVRDQDLLTADYLHRFLHWQYLSGATQAMQSHSTGIRNLDGDAYKAIEVSFPGVAEQNRIVAILDEAFAGIATAKVNAEKNLRNAREMFVGYLDALLDACEDAEERRLGDLVTRLTNGYVGPIRNVYVESGIPYLLARHVRDNNLSFDGKTFITEKFNRKNSKSILKIGDVLLVQSGHIGHSAVVTKEHEGHNCHAMIVITPVEGLMIGDFLSLLFNSAKMRGEFDAIRSGSTVPHLTCKEVREIKIKLPKIAIQKRLVAKSKELQAEAMRLESLCSRKLAALDELKQSILQQAFSGQLT